MGTLSEILGLDFDTTMECSCAVKSGKSATTKLELTSNTSCLRVHLQVKIPKGY